MATLVFLFIFLMFGEISSKHSTKLSRAVKSFKRVTPGYENHVLMSKHLRWNDHKHPPLPAPMRDLNEWLVIGQNEPRTKFFINTNAKPFLMVKK